MLASQVNLDHRLAELRQIGAELRDAQAATGANRSGSTMAAAIRSLLGWKPVARPARVAAR
jgi:hypothetical protein